MAYNGGGGKRLCTGGELDVERSNGSNYMSGEPRRKRHEAPARPNYILLYTVINPAYPITVDVIHTISSPHGNVQRIVVFKKNGVQAMVDTFDSLDSATRAKEALQGADIYSGCCTLKIEYAKPERLNVFKNDQDSWDYTLGEEQAAPAARSAPLLQSPQYTGSRPQPYSEFYDYGSAASCGHQGGAHQAHQAHQHHQSAGQAAPPRRCSQEEAGGAQRACAQTDMDYGSGGPGPGLMKEPRHHPPPPPPHHQLNFDAVPPHQREGRGGGGGGGGFPPEAYGGGEGYAHAHHAPPHHAAMAANQGGGGPQQGAVMMVYGLDPLTTNADRLFNLVCLYGNVVRIKFLKTKEGTAMVQMGDGLSVERCVQNLNSVTVGEHVLTLAFSKQAYLSEVMNPYPLPDKSLSFKDYVGNKNNRFLTPASSHKNRIQPPSKIIHFFNTPPDVSDEQLLQVFTDYGVEPPHHISKFPLKSERSSSGLMEFREVSEAVMAIMACNHATITHPGAKFPFVMKLCFSSARAIGPAQGKAGGGGGGGGSGKGPTKPDNGAEENEEDYF